MSDSDSDSGKKPRVNALPWVMILILLPSSVLGIMFISIIFSAIKNGIIITKQAQKNQQDPQAPVTKDAAIGKTCKKLAEEINYRLKTYRNTVTMHMTLDSIREKLKSSGCYSELEMSIIDEISIMRRYDNNSQRMSTLISMLDNMYNTSYSFILPNRYYNDYSFYNNGYNRYGNLNGNKWNNNHYNGGHRWNHYGRRRDFGTGQEVAVSD